MTASVDVQRVEQIDDVAGVVVDRDRRRIAGAAVEAAELRRDHAPAAVGQRQLPFPHPRVQRKGVKQNEDATPPLRSRRHRLEISQSSDGRHGHILYASRARVERGLASAALAV